MPESNLPHLKFKRARLFKPSFQYRIFLTLLTVSILQLLIIEYTTISDVNDIYIEQAAARALAQSRMVARLPVVREALEQRNPEILATIIPDLKEASGASFIVVGDKNEIRYAHPEPYKIGRQMVGGDNDPALVKGESYSSIRQGSLGWSIRGKTPVLSKSGQIIGVVSVGYMRYQVESRIAEKVNSFLWIFFMVALIVFVSSILIATHLRLQMLGLEPKEIARLLEERIAIMRSLYEGFVAVDNSGTITAANPSARDNLNQGDQPLTGRDLHDFPELMQLVEQNQNESTRDQSVTIGGQSLICNVARYSTKGVPAGTVISFRKKDELEILTRQLTQVRQYADTLRVQSHEYANKLSVIAGMIHLGASEDALKYIESQSRTHQELIDFLNESIHFSKIRALLLGKSHRAREMKVILDIDEGSYLENLPARLNEDDMVAIIGNLLDNAYEAACYRNADERYVTMLMTDLGDNITIEVADNGSGIPETLISKVLQKGYTTKKESGHGIGLHLIHSLVKKAGGTLDISSALPHGAMIKATMPKAESPVPFSNTHTGHTP